MDKARPRLYNAIKLANLLYPKSVAHKPWYIEGINLMNEIRDHHLKALTLKEQKERESTLKAIKDKIDAC